MSVERSVARDAKAIALGLPRVNAEIAFWESKKKKPKCVGYRLERLYEAKKHLINMPKESMSLVEELRKINEGS